MKTYIKQNCKEIAYRELLVSVQKNISEEEFFSAYLCENNFILHIINKTKNSTIEIEYDTEKNRFLTREEREEKVPKDRELFFAEYSVEILIQYYLEEKTDILKESYQIYSLDTDEEIERYTQDFFSMKRTFKDKAKEVYEREKEREIYIKLIDSEKVSYWAGKFYQSERTIETVGDFDMPEAHFISTLGLKKLRGKEPSIDKLMPFILTKLARSWEYDVDEFFERVNHNLGTDYKKVD